MRQEFTHFLLSLMSYGILILFIYDSVDPCLQVLKLASREYQFILVRAPARAPGSGRGRRQSRPRSVAELRPPCLPTFHLTSLTPHTRLRRYATPPHQLIEYAYIQTYFTLKYSVLLQILKPRPYGVNLYIKADLKADVLYFLYTNLNRDYGLYCHLSMWRSIYVNNDNTKENKLMKIFDACTNKQKNYAVIQRLVRQYNNCIQKFNTFPRAH